MYQNFKIYELKKHCMSYSLAVPGSRSVGKIEKACERQAGSGRQKERADLSLPLSDLARRPPLLRLSPLTVSLEHATYVEKTFFFFGLFLMKQKTWNYDGNSWNVSINDIRDFQTPFWLRCSGSNVLNVTSWKFTNGEAEFYCVSWAKCKKCLEFVEIKFLRAAQLVNNSLLSWNDLLWFNRFQVFRFGSEEAYH